MIGHLFNSFEITHKDINGKIDRKYITIGTEKNSRGISCLKYISIEYGRNENIQWFSKPIYMYKTEFIGLYTDTDWEVKEIGNVLYRGKISYKQYPSTMQWYYCRQESGMIYIVMPISSSTAIYLNGYNLNAISTEKPMVFKNAIIGISLRLPNSVSLSVLNSVLQGERRRVNKCKAQVKHAEPSLEDAIAFLDSLSNYPSTVPLKDCLKGDDLVKFHLSIIAVFEHMISRIKKCLE